MNTWSRIQLPQPAIATPPRATQRSRALMQLSYQFGCEFARSQRGNAPEQRHFTGSVRLMDIRSETQHRLAVLGPAL